MKPFLALAAASLALCLAPSAPRAERSTADGVFSEAQAKAGETAYQAHCSGCHGFDLKKTDAEAPDLTGSPFRYGWHDKTVGERYDKIRTTMPKQPLPRLDDQTYVDIIAYILSFNGAPAGPERLPADMAALQAIKIEVPQSAGGGGGGRRR